MKYETIGCNLCGSSVAKVFVNNLTTWEHAGVFQLQKCNNCGLIFLNPRPVFEEIGKYYPDEEYWDINSTDLLRMRHYGFDPLYKIVFSYKKRGTILDIGAGNGIFLSEFKDKGWEVIGTDISKKAANNAKKIYGINIRIGEFLNMKYKINSIDVVALNNSLEHLYYPKETLIRINNLLKEKGLVVITVPNIESLGYKIFGNHWNPLQPPRHLYHFSRQTLSRLLDETGFEVKGDIRNYKAHTVYSLFESFRITFSPKFKQNKRGGINTNVKRKKDILSKLIIETGKLADHIFTYLVYLVELLVNQPETITIYATKR